MTIPRLAKQYTVLNSFSLEVITDDMNESAEKGWTLNKFYTVPIDSGRRFKHYAVMECTSQYLVEDEDI